MAAIYEPKGAAREYSPLAINYITGCDHGCKYCYVTPIMRRFRTGYVHSDVYIKEEKQLLKELKSSCKKFYNSPRQVFFSFLTDPYSHFNKEIKLTRRVLEMFLKAKIPVSILSKGGFNVLEDLDIIKKFGPNIQVGGSLTCTSNEDSLKWESNAALPAERFETLKILHANGVRTWASMEPVIFPDQSLEIMNITKDYVDGYKIGKMNHLKKQEDKVDWPKFLCDSVSLMRKNKSLFYIKEDLRRYSPTDLHLEPHEVDMDFLAIPNRFAEFETV